MDQNTIAFARRWARRYVGEHHPHGLDKSDVENMILRRLHYNKDKGERGRMSALASALNEAQNYGRRSLRALFPWQVRSVEPHLEAQAYRILARDMFNMRIRQDVRERDRLAVRRTVARLSPEDRRIATLYMELLNWKRVAARMGIPVWTFRLHTLPGFILRFKNAWAEEGF